MKLFLNGERKVFGLLILILGPLIFALFLLYGDMGESLRGIGISEMAQVFRSLGVWAVLISLTLNIAQTFVVFMPSVLLSGVNTVVFGLFWGILLSWAGEVIGAAAAFGVYRRLGRSTIETMEQNRAYLKKIDDISSRKGFATVLVLRLLPAFPSGAVNLLAALSKISFGAFLGATALGKLPSLILEAMVGHDLLTWRQNLDRLIALVAFVVLLYLGWKVNQRLKQK